MFVLNFQKQPIKLPKAEVEVVPESVTPDIISSTEKRVDMPPHEPVASIAQQFTQSAPETQVAAQKLDIIQHHEVVEEAAAAVEPNNGNYENILKQQQEHNESVISEQELIDQLKNDNVDVDDEIVEEQFVLSPDNPGITAIALYDYQAAADDEISFDPDDLITHIDMIDDGWYKGLHAKTFTYGLFPANYCKVLE